MPEQSHQKLVIRQLLSNAMPGFNPVGVESLRFLTSKRAIRKKVFGTYPPLASSGDFLEGLERHAG